MKIALLGRLRSGKTTAMNFMINFAQNEFNIKLVPKPLAEPIYKEAKAFYERHGLVWRKNRRLMEGMGQALNEDYPNGDKIVELFDKDFNPDDNLIVEDCRRITQADYLKDRGFQLIRISASEEIRKQRCKPGEFSSGHITDIELDDYSTHYNAINEGNLEQLKIECEEIISCIMKLKTDLRQ